MEMTSRNARTTPVFYIIDGGMVEQGLHLIRRSSNQFCQNLLTARDFGANMRGTFD
jgi:hypothetical protein